MAYPKIVTALFTLLIPCLGFSQLKSDDPILAAFDSLANARFNKSLFGEQYKSTGGVNPYTDEATYKKRLAELDRLSPFEFTYNDITKKYLESNVEKRRGTMAKVLGLSELYFPLFEEKLAKNNMPQELKYLAVVESALNPRAKSRVGATGLWQFMYATGRGMGLKVNSYVDERSDPVKSTDAACRYLKELYNTFGDWQLALAAYNSGPGNVIRAMRRAGGKNFWEIRPFLPSETAGYVPAFIAAAYAMKFYKEHNIAPIKPERAFYELDTIHVQKKLTFKKISSVLDISIEEIQFLNPQYVMNTIPAPDDEPSILTLTRSDATKFLNNQEKMYYIEPPRPKPQPQPAVVDSNATQDTTPSNTTQPVAAASTTTLPNGNGYHMVKYGENIYKIAVKYNIEVEQIQSWNAMRGFWLNIGEVISIHPSTARKSNSIKIDRPVKTTPKPVATPVIKTPPTPPVIVLVKPVVSEAEKIKKAEDLKRKLDEQKRAKEELAKKKADELKEKLKKEAELKKKADELKKKEEAAKKKIEDKKKEEQKKKDAKKKSISHKVEKGETLGSIAQKHGTTVEEIKRVNNLKTNVAPLGKNLKILK